MGFKCSELFISSLASPTPALYNRTSENSGSLGNCLFTSSALTLHTITHFSFFSKLILAVFENLVQPLDTHDQKSSIRLELWGLPQSAFSPNYGGAKALNLKVALSPADCIPLSGSAWAIASSAPHREGISVSMTARNPWTAPLHRAVPYACHLFHSYSFSFMISLRRR